jgi:hypothetical protein
LENNLNDDKGLVFVGGAPRSGTTLTHAIICSAPEGEVNRYCAEISFFGKLVEAIAFGMKVWGRHTKAFFDSQQDLNDHGGEILFSTLDKVRTRFGDPKLLALKDPLLTPNFPLLYKLLDGNVRFVTIVRHPYSVVRSRQEVARKGGSPFSAREVTAISKQYVNSYKHLSSPIPRDKICLVRYEDLASEETNEKLKSFLGLSEFSESRMWGAAGARPIGQEKKEALTKANKPVSGTAWASPKYGTGIDLSDRLGELDDEYKVIVRKICGGQMRSFGYDE